MSTNIKKNKKIQKEIYGNIKMLHPDGTLMCTTSKYRANNYVKKQLAVWIDDNTFQLTFEPQGHGKSHMPFYTQQMNNCCVVCGNTERLTRHHVLPYVFRRRLPVQYKSSNHHDILALCHECHENYEHHADSLKNQIAQDNGYTIVRKENDELRNNRHIRSAKAVLEKVKLGLIDVKILPQERLKELEDVSKREYYLGDEVGDTRWVDDLVTKIVKADAIFEFIKLWRQHFLTYTQPKFLPENWSLNYELEKY